ncbi:MAG: prepilin peptidase [Rhodopirellula sp. JB055]|uniref:prepilin peptidase n=1 Tax=Rhodopirellula sp. JB055 TaxID=3342846 RepID=UPI00370BD341
MIESLFVLCLPIIVCGVATFFDLRTREIPDWVWGVLVLAMPVRGLIVGQMLPWWQYAVGGVLALLLALIVGKGDRFGGGDIKLFGALGLWFGVFAVFPLALWIAIAGLPLAVIAAARKQSDFAYAPAIFLGVCVHCFSPNLLQRIML